jgi:superfamily II DNA or RNA helicase
VQVTYREKDELEVAERRLRELDAERAALTARIAELQAVETRAAEAAKRVAVAGQACDGAVAGPNTAAEKVALFRRMFAGRQDVFPRLWVNARDGRKGYAPACSNEWVRGVCEKPRVRCGDCDQQAFLPVTDEVVEGHLLGRHVVGVYPLLPDGTCRFLAMDFDDEGWQEDVAALTATCRRLGVPIAVERSRSGDGAHAWFFYSEPVQARVARRMGFGLLAETGAKVRDLGLKSFDRLFPNQDALPKGGFGNLIALPLQKAARRAGNSEFVDESLRPWPDQWRFLAGHPALSGAQAATLATSLNRNGGGEPDRGATTPANGNAPPPTGDEPRWPEKVAATLAARLTVATEGLHSVHVGALRRLAAFSNPEFFRRRNLRLSTARTPRFIGSAEDVEGGISLPRGLLEAVRRLLDERGVAFELDDARVDGGGLSASFSGELTPRQNDAVAALTPHDDGVLVAPPGSGKTVVAAAMIARRGRSTLVLVHRRALVEQWIARLRSFLAVTGKDVAAATKSKRAATAPIVVATLQSLARRPDLERIARRFGHVVVDECHHVPARSFERVFDAVGPRFLLGLTATPKRRDGLDPLLSMRLGPVRHVAPPIRDGAPSLRLHPCESALDAGSLPADTPIQSLYALAAADPARNDLILDVVLTAYDAGRSVLLLTERRDHLELLAGSLRRVVPDLCVLHGGLGTLARKAEVARLSTGSVRLVAATGRYIGEGADFPALDTLVIALPVAWKGTVVQYVGRIQRATADKRDVLVYDVGDPRVPAFARMAEKRRRALRALGFEVVADEAAAPSADRRRIINDDDAAAPEES